MIARNCSCYIVRVNVIAPNTHRAGKLADVLPRPKPRFTIGLGLRGGRRGVKQANSEKCRYCDEEARSKPRDKNKRGHSCPSTFLGAGILCLRADNETSGDDKGEATSGEATSGEATS